MSDEQVKVKHSKRIQQKETKLEKKIRLAKEYNHEHALKNPHKYHKTSLFNCGNSNCVMCGNPRKTFEEMTIQEKRHYQETEILRGRRSNGLIVDEIEVYLEVRNGKHPTY